MGAAIRIFTFLIATLLAAQPRQPVSAAEWNNAGAAFFSSGKYAEAERAFQTAFELERAQPDAALRATVSFNLAAAYRSQARFREAEPLYRQAMELRQAIFGANDPGLVGALHGLSATLLALGKLQGAEQAAQRAVAIREAEPERLLELAVAQTYLVNVLIAESLYGQAAAIGKSALSNLELARSTETVPYAESLNSLGIVYRNLSKFPEAEAYLQRSSGLFEKLLGARDPATAAAWNNLGQVMCSEKKFPEARRLFEKAIAGWEAAYGHERPDVAAGLTNLASAYQAMKKYETARQLFRESLAIDEHVMGERNPKTARDLNNLGSLALNRRRYQDAEPLLARALSIYLHLGDETGPGSYEIGLVSGNLALAYYKQHRYAEAETLFGRAARIRERLFGPADPSLAKLLDAYARVLRINRKYVDAAGVETHAMNLRVRAVMGNQSLAQ